MNENFELNRRIVCIRSCMVLLKLFQSFITFDETSWLDGQREGYEGDGCSREDWIYRTPLGNVIAVS